MEGKAEPTKNVFAVGALVISEQIAEQRPTLTEDSRNLHPKEKGLEVAKKKKQETSQNVPLGTVDLKLSDHGGTAENDVVVDESSEEATGTMPPLPPAPWFKKTKMSKHTEMHCGRFSKHCHGNDCRNGEESSFFDCWDEQSDILQQAYPWAQNSPKSVSRCERVPLS